MNPSNLQVALISRYPPPGQTHVGRGINSYSKQLATELTRNVPQLTLIAERLNGKVGVYVEDRVSVRRVWRHGFKASGDIKKCLTNLRPSVVHFQHELFSFGPAAAALVPRLLLPWIKRRWPLVTTLHGVIPKEELGTQLLEAYGGSLPPVVISRLYGWITRHIAEVSDVVIVHSEELQEALSAYTSEAQTRVVPHGIQKGMQRLRRQDALAKLGLPDAKRAVFFGFLSPYKGIETVVEAVPYLNKHGIEVLIAGSQSGDPKSSHSSIVHVPPIPGVRRMGFVPEPNIQSLFSVADVLVLPYRIGLSASGPLALAAAFGTPVVVSDVPALERALRCPDATFQRGNAEELAKAVLRVVLNTTVRETVLACLRRMAGENSWGRAVNLTVDAYLEALSQRN